MLPAWVIACSTGDAACSLGMMLIEALDELPAVRPQEELQTVNADLMSRLQEPALAQSDLKNLPSSTQIATLFLDGAMHVRRFVDITRARLLEARLRQADGDPAG